MKKTVNQKEMLIKALSTLFYSWGSDTPPEVYWGANELLDWYEKEFDLELGIRFISDEITFVNNYEEVIEAIRNT
jgi:hypothetical protein